MTDTLPPLPTRKRSMLCTMCGYQNRDTQALTPHARCENEKCGYEAFVTENALTDDEVRKYAAQAVEDERERLLTPLLKDGDMHIQMQRRHKGELVVSRFHISAAHVDSGPRFKVGAIVEQMVRDIETKLKEKNT